MRRLIEPLLEVALDLSGFCLARLADRLHVREKPCACGVVDLVHWIHRAADFRIEEWANLSCSHLAADFFICFAACWQLVVSIHPVSEMKPVTANLIPRIIIMPPRAVKMSGGSE